jgi:hypothetical protein
VEATYTVAGGTGQTAIDQDVAIAAMRERYEVYRGLLAVTFVAVYRQLRIQRAAAAIEQMDRLQAAFTPKEMTRALLSVLVAVRDDPDLRSGRSAGATSGASARRSGSLSEAGTSTVG